MTKPQLRLPPKPSVGAVQVQSQGPTKSQSYTLGRRSIGRSIGRRSIGSRGIGSRGIGSSLRLGVTDKETSALAGPGADEDGSARASAVGNRKIST